MVDDNEELQSYLNALPEKLERELAGVIQEQAEMLSGAQRAALQSFEQDPPDSGGLEDSCTVIPGRNALEVYVVAGGDLTTGDIRDGSGVPYDHALAFEFGNSRQPARPFFFSTYNAHRDQMQDAIQTKVEEILND